MDSKLQDVAIAAISNSQVTADALQRLEAQLAIDREAVSDTPSLRSLASSISRLESLLSPQPGSPASFHSSAHCSSAGSRRSLYNMNGRRGSVNSDTRSNASSSGSRRHPQSFLQFGKPGAYNVQHHKQFLKLARPKTQPVHITIEQERREALWNEKWSPGTTQNTSQSTAIDAEHDRDSKGLDKEAPSNALLESYNRFLDIADGACPEPLIAYINLIQFSRTIKLHAKLIASIRTSQLNISNEQLHETTEYQEIYEQLKILDHDVRVARQVCWEKGYDLGEVDMILESGCIHDLPLIKLDYEKEMRECHEYLSALQRRLEKLQAWRVWSSRQDRINQWLLQKLAASSDEAVLHRSFLEGGDELDEQQWARLVLKFWPLDGAAVHFERRVASTNGAVDSGRDCHSVKVLLDMVELENSVFSVSDLSEITEVRKRTRELERLKTPLKETASFAA